MSLAGSAVLIGHLDGCDVRRTGAGRVTKYNNSLVSRLVFGPGCPTVISWIGRGVCCKGDPKCCAEE